MCVTFLHYYNTDHDQRAAIPPIIKDPHNISKPLSDHTHICFHEKKVVFNGRNDHPAPKNGWSSNNVKTIKCGGSDTWVHFAFCELWELVNLRLSTDPDCSPMIMSKDRLRHVKYLYRSILKPQRVEPGTAAAAAKRNGFDFHDLSFLWSHPRFLHELHHQSLKTTPLWLCFLLAIIIQIGHWSNISLVNYSFLLLSCWLNKPKMPIREFQIYYSRWEDWSHHMNSRWSLSNTVYNNFTNSSLFLIS